MFERFERCQILSFRQLIVPLQNQLQEMAFHVGEVPESILLDAQQIGVEVFLGVWSSARALVDL